MGPSLPTLGLLHTVVVFTGDADSVPRAGPCLETYLVVTPHERAMLLNITPCPGHPPSPAKNNLAPGASSAKVERCWSVALRVYTPRLCAVPRIIAPHHSFSVTGRIQVHAMISWTLSSWMMIDFRTTIQLCGAGWFQDQECHIPWSEC